MRITEITCKTALSSSSLPGLPYSLNPYRGCAHNCAYCYVPNIFRIKRESWGTFVEVKTNIPVILSQELKRKQQGPIGLSTVTDPYQPLEKKYRLSRYCLEQLIRYDFPVCIQTKSALVLRDVDLIRQLSQGEVMMSIGTLHDDQRRVLEPRSSSISERLQVLEELANSTIKTSVFFGPIYPTITPEEVPEIIDTFIQHQVSEVMIDQLNLKPGIWDTMKKTLSCNPTMHTLFSQNLFENPDYYNTIRDMFYSVGKKKHLTIVDAFS